MEGGQGAHRLRRPCSPRSVPSPTSSSAPSGEASCSPLQPRVPGMDASWGRVLTAVHSGEWVHMGEHSLGGRILCTHLGAEVPMCTRLGIFCSFLEMGCTRMCTSGKVYTHTRLHMSSVHSPVCAHLDATWLCLARLLRVRAPVAGFAHCRWHGPSQTSVFPGSMHTSVSVCMCTQFRHISCVCVVTMDACLVVLRLVWACVYVLRGYPDLSSL